MHAWYGYISTLNQLTNTVLYLYTVLHSSPIHSYKLIWQREVLFILSSVSFYLCLSLSVSVSVSVSSHSLSLTHFLVYSFILFHSHSHSLLTTTTTTTTTTTKLLATTLLSNLIFVGIRWCVVLVDVMLLLLLLLLLLLSMMELRFVQYRCLCCRCISSEYCTSIYYCYLEQNLGHSSSFVSQAQECVIYFVLCVCWRVTEDECGTLLCTVI